MYAIVILAVFSLFRQLNQMKSRSQYIYLTPPMPLFPLNVYKLDYAFITRAYAFPLPEYSWLQRVLPTVSWAGQLLIRFPARDQNPLLREAKLVNV